MLEEVSVYSQDVHMTYVYALKVSLEMCYTESTEQILNKGIITQVEYSLY